VTVTVTVIKIDENSNQLIAGSTGAKTSPRQNLFKVEQVYVCGMFERQFPFILEGDKE